MAITKSDAEEKRKYAIEETKAQVSELRKILFDFGDIPGIADNVDANILLNQILWTKQDCEKRIKAFQFFDDNFILSFDVDLYLRLTQDKIAFYKSSYENYKFEATLGRQY